MKPRSRALLISTAILCAFGVRAVYHTVEPFFVGHSGPLTAVAPIWDTISQVIAALFWFGLAVLHWLRGGAWGLGIGIFAIVMLVIQSYLLFLAVTQGGIPLTTGVIMRTLLTSLEDLALCTSSFLSHVSSKKRTA
jgi:hypothetical protein